MEEEQWETQEYCHKCREYHLVNEEMATWFCPKNGSRPEVKKALDLALDEIGDEIRRIVDGK